MEPATFYLIQPLDLLHIWEIDLEQNRRLNERGKERNKTKASQEGLSVTR